MTSVDSHLWMVLIGSHRADLNFYVAELQSAAKRANSLIEFMAVQFLIMIPDNDFYHKCVSCHCEDSILSCAMLILHAAHLKTPFLRTLGNLLLLRRNPCYLTAVRATAMCLKLFQLLSALTIQPQHLCSQEPMRNLYQSQPSHSGHQKAVLVCSAATVRATSLPNQ